jgi:Tfp pilus assembly protein PilP
MKLTLMRLTTGILAVVMMTGAAWAQNPDAIDNARSITKSLQRTQANATDAALAVAAGTPQQGSKPEAAAAQTSAKPKTAPTVAAKSQDIFAPKKPGAKAPTAAKQVVKKPAHKAPVKTVIAAATEVPAKTIVAAEKPVETKAEATPAPKPEEKKWAMTGKRDPFFSPIVQQPAGSGCSSGKKCLEIGQINLRGVVKADSGFIAVVTNSLNKAYFLHENDPVFNGYVMRITGDSVVFSETLQDKLGKPLQHEVTKKITAPAV